MFHGRFEMSSAHSTGLYRHETPNETPRPWAKKRPLSCSPWQQHPLQAPCHNLEHSSSGNSSSIINQNRNHPGQKRIRAPTNTSPCPKRPHNKTRLHRKTPSTHAGASLLSPPPPKKKDTLNSASATTHPHIRNHHPVLGFSMFTSLPPLERQDIGSSHQSHWQRQPLLQCAAPEYLLGYDRQPRLAHHALQPRRLR